MKLEDLYETWDSSLIPLNEISPKTSLQKQWSENGFLLIKNLINDNLIDNYVDEWIKNNGGSNAILGDISTYKSPGGYDYATPYMDNPYLKRLVTCKEISNIMEELLGEPAGVHLNLTGFVSTRRDWHRDQYLNESFVGGFYVAIWIALDDINADAGPFEYIPGSHLGDPISQKKMRIALGRDGDGPDWPTHSERILTPLFENEISNKKLIIKNNVGMSKGDVLFWHGKLLHRGTTPKNLNAERRSCIAHYSGINHRPDMPKAIKDGDGWIFPLHGRMPARYKAMS